MTSPEDFPDPSSEVAIGLDECATHTTAGSSAVLGLIKLSFYGLSGRPALILRNFSADNLPSRNCCSNKVEQMQAAVSQQA